VACVSLACKFGFMNDSRKHTCLTTRRFACSSCAVLFHCFKIRQWQLDATKYADLFIAMFHALRALSALDLGSSWTNDNNTNGKRSGSRPSLFATYAWLQHQFKSFMWSFCGLNAIICMYFKGYLSLKQRCLQNAKGQCYAVPRMPQLHQCSSALWVVWVLWVVCSVFPRIWCTCVLAVHLCPPRHPPRPPDSS
jgi:hypothetical protein